MLLGVASSASFVWADRDGRTDPGAPITGRQQRRRQRPSQGSNAQSAPFGRHTTGGIAITVADEGEFGLIAKVTQALTTTPEVLLGPGDDAAVVRTADGRVVASTDLLVENVHFRRDWSTAHDVGRRAAAANLADIVAMGAVPTALLIGFAAPADLPVEWAMGITEGLREECGLIGAAIVGGDIVRAPTLMLAVTALGDLQGRAPVLRSTAKAGDKLWLAGRIGWAAAGLAVLSRGFRSPVQVVAAHRRPEPPYAEGPRAADLGATAMIDVSDGLLADAGHIAESSGVCLDIATKSLDVPLRLREVASALNAEPMDWVLTGGDDHALLATFPASVDPGPAWRQIGEVTEGSGVRVDGQRRRFAGGHDHYK